MATKYILQQGTKLEGLRTTVATALLGANWCQAGWIQLFRHVHCVCHIWEAGEWMKHMQWVEKCVMECKCCAVRVWLHSRPNGHSYAEILSHPEGSPCVNQSAHCRHIIKKVTRNRFSQLNATEFGKRAGPALNISVLFCFHADRNKINLLPRGNLGCVNRTENMDHLSSSLPCTLRRLGVAFQCTTESLAWQPHDLRPHVCICTHAYMDWYMHTQTSVKASFMHQSVT